MRLPWCTASVCLPLLFRLWAGKGTASPVELAGGLLGLIATEFPDRLGDDVLTRRLAEPWYDSKTEPSFEDMIAKLRRTLIATRFAVVPPGHVDPDLLRDYSLACMAAAA